MRVRRPDKPGQAWLRLTLLFVSLAAWTLVGCGGAAYSKAAYGEPRAYGGTPASAPSPQEPVAAGVTATSGREEAAPGAAYDYALDDEVAGGAQLEAAPAEPRPAPAAPLMNAQIDRRTAQRAPTPKKAAEPAPPPAQGQPSAPAEPTEIATDVAPIQQMLIYTAQLRMAVFETAKSLAAVEELARELGGFLAHRADNQITIRVPVQRFDEAMKRISGQGDVLSRNVQVEDVTEQFLDISLRLKNARQVRERIAALLANAKTVEESLKVEQELNRLSEEIERLEGRLKYLSDRARYSTITVTFEPMHTDDMNPNRAFQLPFPWLADLGLGRLMTLR